MCMTQATSLTPTSIEASAAVYVLTCVKLPIDLSYSPRSTALFFIQRSQSRHHADHLVSGRRRAGGDANTLPQLRLYGRLHAVIGAIYCIELCIPQC